MKLEGSLDAFSLPDIFQLLSFTKKTGGLHLASSGADGVVFFATGQVTGASADGSRQPLARRIVGSGAVSDDALVAAVDAASAGDGVGVVKALFEADAVDPDLLRRATHDQAVDAIFDLLRWQEGDFAFVLDEPNPDDVGITLAVEEVLAEAEGRREAWDAVSQVVPSPDAVLTMPVVLGGDPVVSREEWSLLALVDGRRTVADLVDLTGSGQYAVVSTLAALVHRGLLEVRDGEPEDHVAVVVRRQQLLSPLERFTPVVVPVQPEQHVEVAEAEPVAEEPHAEEPHVEPVALADHLEAVEHVEHGPVAVDDVAAAPAPAEERSEPAGQPEPELVTASAAPEQPQMLGGAHVPQDVVPPRPEPFLPKRQADFDEGTGAVPRTAPGVPGGGVGDVVGATATAADPAAASVIERDPNVNRSLMLRLIAGVRGL